jgi:hypothetical protein
MSAQLPPDVRVSRFSARFAFHDTPEAIERLEAIAAESATSAASIVRLALRQFLSGLRRRDEGRMSPLSPAVSPTGLRTADRARAIQVSSHPIKGWSNRAGSMGSDWSRIRAEVLGAEPRCISCGAHATTVDHIIARALGGTDARSNLQALCGPFHRRKTQAEALEGRRRKRGAG